MPDRRPMRRLRRPGFPRCIRWPVPRGSGDLASRERQAFGWLAGWAAASPGSHNCRPGCCPGQWRNDGRGVALPRSETPPSRSTGFSKRNPSRCGVRGITRRRSRWPCGPGVPRPDGPVRLLGPLGPGAAGPPPRLMQRNSRTGPRPPAGRPSGPGPGGVALVREPELPVSDPNVAQRVVGGLRGCGGQRSRR